MDIAIYVGDEQSTTRCTAMAQQLGDLPEGHTLRVVDVSQPSAEGLPAEVVQVMLKRGERALPLMTVDGEPALSGRLPTAYEVVSLLPDDGTRPTLVTTADSAVDFPTQARIHVSLNVTSLDTSLPFYRMLFDTEPTKLKPYYAKFELDVPPMNITVNERPFEKPKEEGAVGHFGIQVKSSDEVTSAKERFLKAGYYVEEETQTACCYAVQTKCWVGDPDGNRWEVFVTTEPEATEFCPADCLCYARMSPTAIERPVVGVAGEGE